MRSQVWCVFVLVLCLIEVSLVVAWGGSRDDRDRVLLEKVSAITLEEGKKTNSRRTSPIPQLDCVGGSAGCYSYRPKVVQCLNAGFDGYDVQWECKAEMDTKYKFGRIEVSCEGYDHPDDPYVLRGSCGLKYELDLTDEGHRAKRSSFHQSHGDRPHHYNSGGSSWLATIIQLAVIAGIIYCCLGACFGPRRSIGANSGYTGGSGEYSSSSYGSYGTNHRGGSGPGFWTGAATGGALGYLFGNRNTGRPYYGGGGWGSGWNGGGWGSGWNSGGGWGGRNSTYRSSGGGSGNSGSSSRTTSGFGGTSRR